MILKSRSSPAPCQLSSVVAMSKLLLGSIESRLGRPSSLRRALAGHIPSVCLPLAWILIRGVADADGYALIERAGRPAHSRLPYVCRCAFLSSLRHLDEAKHGSENTCVLARIFVWAVL